MLQNTTPSESMADMCRDCQNEDQQRQHERRPFVHHDDTRTYWSMCYPLRHGHTLSRRNYVFVCVMEMERGNAMREGWDSRKEGKRPKERKRCVCVCVCVGFCRYRCVLLLSLSSLSSLSSSSSIDRLADTNHKARSVPVFCFVLASFPLARTRKKEQEIKKCVCVCVCEVTHTRNEWCCAKRVTRQKENGNPKRTLNNRR